MNQQVSPQVPPQQPVCLWAVGAELGEGPLWHAATRTVYFVDIKGRQVLCCSEDGTLRRSWTAHQQIGFIVPVAGGGFVCGLEDGLYRFDPVSGEFSTLRSVEHNLPGNRFNDGYVDAHGALWFGSMDNSEERPSGSLYRLGAGRGLSVQDSGYIITNGPAVSPDGKTLYHTDTLKKQIYAFDLLPDGGVANKRSFVTIQGEGYPDGMAVDADGCVWIALFGGARIERYSAQGALLGQVAFPCPNITKLAFGGDDLRTVFVTTARKGMSDEARARLPLAGGLFSFRVETPGLAQHEFSIGAFA
jgi:D-xylonolactonase